MAGRAVFLATPPSMCPSASAGEITGVVQLLELPPPENKVTTADSRCYLRAPGGVIQTRHYLTGPGNGLADVVVFLKDVPGPHPAPSNPAVLEYVGCTFQPYVLGLQEGQTLEVRNTDPWLHNFYADGPFSGGGSIVFSNRAIQGGATWILPAVRWNPPDLLVRFTSQIDPWMFAYAVVLPHPYFAVTTGDGAYRIPGVPKGVYTLVAFHRKTHEAAFRALRREVTIGDTPVRIDFTISTNRPIPPPLTILTTHLSLGTVGAAYRQVLRADGGWSGWRPYSWRSPGPLPPGITLSSNGVVSGTPSSPGKWTLELQVADDSGRSTVTQVVFRARRLMEAMAIAPETVAATSGGVRFRLASAPADPVVVEGSEDLVEWRPMLTNASPEQAIPLGVGARHGFFRIRTSWEPADMAWIGPGTFTMGSPLGEPGRDSDEAPHEVAITRGFYLGHREVMQAEYLEVMQSNPSWYRGTNLPVTDVSWHAATNYCAQRTEREWLEGRLPDGWSYRLPREAEWEYACRAGTLTATVHGPALGSTQENFSGDAPYHGAPPGPVLGRPAAGGSYPANPWGLQDMPGNVAEWCWDWYAPYPTQRITDPAGPPTGWMRVVRGGSYLSRGERCRSANRDAESPHSSRSTLGFRVVLDPSR